MSLYDPNDLSYLDPVAARSERDRTFQVCTSHPMQVMARAYGIDYES